MTNHVGYLHSRHIFEKFRLLYSSIKYVRQLTKSYFTNSPITNSKFKLVLFVKKKLNLNDGGA